MSDSVRGPRSPRVARWLLQRLLGRKHLEYQGTELEELFRRRIQHSGLLRARVWYWRQLVGFVIRWRAIKRDPTWGLHDALTGTPPRGGTFALDSLGQDIRFGFRTFRRKPLFTFVAIATLGLGIGATTTIYGIADAVLLQALPYPDAHSLVSIWTTRLNDRGEWVTESLYPPEYRRLRDHASTLENVALYFYAGGSLQGRGDPMNLIVGEGTSTLPDVAGIQPRLGRWFRPEEVGRERTYVAVLGDTLWRTRFGADPKVVGTTALIEHHPYTIIGVMPPEFRFRLGLFRDNQGLLSPQDRGERPVWVPSGHNYGSDWYDATEGYSFEALARLRPGVSLQAARAEIEALVRGDTPADRIRVHVARRDRLELAGLPAQLLLLAVPSALLLLIACGNVATLLLGESEGRRQEIATRAAVGAGSGRIVRQLLTESVLLGLGGSAIGAALAFGATQTLVALAPASSAMEGVRVNLSVLAFCCGVGMLAGASFGLVPALLLAKRHGWQLQGHGSRLTGRGGRRVNTLVGLEVTLTVVLLIAGGLFARTLLNLTAVRMGFEPEHLVAFPAAIEGGVPAEQRAVAYSEMLTRMEAVPGVEAATGSWSMPLLMSLWNQEVATEGADATDRSRLPVLSYDVVMPDYHETMEIPLLAGRYFTTADGPGAPPVVIVSQSTAARLWPDKSAVGQRLRFADLPEWHTVVGVVGDVRYGGLDAEARSPIYTPFLQHPGMNGIRLVLTARTTVDPWTIIPQLEAAARSAYPSVLLRPGQVLSQAVSESATDQRYRALLVMTFGLAAMVLAAVGIFGVVARATAQRSHELAIRMALGADAGRLRSLVMGRTLLGGAAGVGAGLIVAALGSRLIQRFLFGVQSFDALTYWLVTLTVLLVCGAAGYLPARRLLLVQPASMLKQE